MGKATPPMVPGMIYYLRSDESILLAPDEFDQVDPQQWAPLDGSVDSPSDSPDRYYRTETIRRS